MARPAVDQSLDGTSLTESKHIYGRVSWPAWARYGFAAATVGVAMAIGLAGERLGPYLGWCILFAAMVAVAWMGGLGPAVVALGLGAVAGSTLLRDQAWIAGPRQGETLALLGTMAAATLLIGLAGDRLRKMRAAFEAQCRACQGATAALAASDQRFHAIFEQAAVGICLATLDGQMKLVNQKLCAMLGYSREELLTLSYQQITYPEDWLPQVVQAKRLQAGEIDNYTMRKRYLRKDGSILWADLTCSAIRDGTACVVAIIEDMTDRRRAEEALVRVRERYAALFDRSLDCVYLLDFEGHFLDANQAAIELLGYTREEIRAVDLSTLIDAEQLRLALRRVEEVRQTGHTLEPAVFRARRKDGQEVIVETRASVILEEGKPSAIQGIARDITARKRIENELRESEEKFRNLAETMHAAVGVVQGARFVYANPYMGLMLGYSVEELLRTDFPQLVHPSHRERMIDLARRRQMGEPVPSHYEFLALTRSGESRWVEFSAAKTMYKGRPAIIGTGFDITERKRIEEALRLNEARLRQIIDLVPHFIFAKDLEGRILLANKSQAEAYGLTVEELVGRNHAEVHGDTEEVRHMLADDREVIESGRPKHIAEETYLRSDGSRQILQTVKIPFTASGTNTPAMLGVAVDITERKKAEERLKGYSRGLKLLAGTATRLLSAERPRDVLHEIFDELADHLHLQVYLSYLVVDGGTRLQLHAQRGLDEGTWKQVAHVEVGRTLCGVAAQERRPVIMEDVQSSDDPRAELIRRAGVRAYACHPFLANSHVVGTLAACAADRDRFNEEELELMRAISHQAAMALEHQRLTAEVERRAGELAEANQAKDHFMATLSHELRTPLTPVMAAMSLLEREADLSPGAREDLQMIRRNVELEARLIDDLLDVTRITRGKIKLEKHPVQLATVLRRAVEVCEGDIEAKRLRFSMDAGAVESCWVEGDAARLQQVFWNILKNAIKFTPHGGVVGLRSRVEGGTAVTELTDNGVGIDAEAVRRIFNPFEQGEHAATRQFGGLGLGLTISRAMVELHGGTISVHSEGRDRGATFTVKLPIAEHASPGEGAPPAAAGGAQPATAALRILLVEDHADTARIIGQLLSLEGHQVEVAVDVATALEAMGRAKFDALISDLGLPDGSGIDLMRTLRERGEAIPAIALSGYGQEEDIRRSCEAGFIEHLIKPIDINQLLVAIRKVMQPA